MFSSDSADAGNARESAGVIWSEKYWTLSIKERRRIDRAIAALLDDDTDD